MALTNIKYSDAEKTTISATENGVLLSIPVSAGNKEYDTIISEGLTVGDYVAPDETWETVRGKRNQLLKDTDWQAGSDVTMSAKQKAYRKKLRDLPATNADPTKIVFPDAP
jgi:hypothetical protein